MGIRSTSYVIDMVHYPAPGSLDEQGVGRPVLELRDTWGRFILLATKAMIESGGMPSPICPCGSSKKPCPGRVVLGAGDRRDLLAKCDRCAFFASITNWSGSWWDWSMGAPFTRAANP